MSFRKYDYRHINEVSLNLGRGGGVEGGSEASTLRSRKRYVIWLLNTLVPW